MKKITLNLFLLFILISNFAKSQTPPDRWDTLYNQTNFFPVDYFDQCSSVAANGKLFLYGDSANVSNPFYQRQSYIAVFNPTTSVLTPLNYSRSPEDKGLNSDASIATSTPGVSYSFFGGKLDNSVQTNSLTLYKLNTQSNAVTYEQITYPTAGYNSGIESLCFFSPLSNHDTLLIFDDSLGQKISIYKKHFNQVGFANTNNLSLPLTNVYSTFVFNNALYISGRDNINFNNVLMNSTNGVTFTFNSNFASQVGYKITAMDTLNNVLYFAIDDGDGSYAIWKTPDGLNYTQLTSTTAGRVMSLKKYKNGIWFNVTSSGKPTVMYLSGPTLTTVVTSVQDIGRYNSQPYTFRLNKLNSELYFAGSFEDGQAFEYGTFIYKFIPPVANFTLANTQLCFGQPYSVVSNSQNADSVRWITDNNFYAGTLNNFTFGFSTSGSHTVGVIAISGTQKDTMMISVNVYSTSLSITGPATACQVTAFQLHSTAVNTQGTVTYTWNQTPTFTVVVNGANPFISASNAGPLAYYAISTDINGCQATSNIVTVQVYASKNISGVVTTPTSVAVAGDVVLYKYVPYLTKFDSVTYQTLNTIGGYTFNTVDSGTYLVKCLPTATSLQITYCNSSISWQSAQVLTHGCVNTSTQNINVIPFTNLGTGAGELAGTITEGQGYGQRTNGITTPGAPIKGVIVKGGRNPGGDITAQSRTNSSGQYTLNNMPLSNPGESYFILVDIPGLDTNTTYHRVITSTSLQFTNLDFVVDSAKVNPIGNFVGVQEVKINNSKISVYPNPASGNVTIEFALDKPSHIKVDVTDMFGRKIKTLLPVSYQNEQEVKITAGLKGISPGVYFIKISIDDAERTTKLIIAE